MPWWYNVIKDIVLTLLFFAYIGIMQNVREDLKELVVLYKKDSLYTDLAMSQQPENKAN